ncbi:MAG: PAS domain S-box protein, partial [Pseudomonadota bacterium]
ATFVIDDEGKVTAWNKAIAEMTGVSAADMVGKGDYEYAVPFYGGRRPLLINLVVKPDDQIADSYLSFKQEAGRVFSEAYLPDMGGRGPAWVWSTATRLLDPEGRTVGAIQSIRDISDRKRTETALGEAEERFRFLVENAPEPVFVQTEYCFAYLNRAALRAFGADTPDDLLSKPVLDRFEAGFHDRIKERIRLLNEEKQCVTNQEQVYLKTDGSHFRVEVSAIPIRWEGKDGALVMFHDITERKRVEEALRESENRLQLALLGADLGVWDMDVPTGKVKVNTRFLEIIEYESGGAVQTLNAWAKGLHADDRERAVSALNAHIRGDTDNYRNEYRYRTKSGEWKWILSTGKVVRRDEKGEALRMTGTWLDITDRKMSEEALRLSEERYRTVADFTHDWEYWVDPGGGLLYVSPACERITGYSAREFIDDPSLMELILHPDDRDDVTNHFRTARGEGRDISYSVDFRIVRRDGQLRWINHACLPVYKEGGEFSGRRGSNRDISDRKKYETAQRRLATAVVQADEAIVITDPKGNIEYVNPAFERISGYARDELLKHKASLLDSAYYDPESLPTIRDAFLKGERRAGRLLKIRKNGEAYEEDVTISPVRDNTGSIVNFVVTGRDVSTEVRLQRQLFQAQKMEAVGTLAGGVAHDFNNLLTVVLGYSELLLDEPDLPPRIRLDLEKINRTAGNGAELVRRLLTFGRKAEIKPCALNLNERMEQLQKMLSRIIPKMIDIRLLVSHDLSAINADPTQMDQILLNLAVNARDAMPDGGSFIIETVNVTLDEDYCRQNICVDPGRYVLLTVSDTGTGMDKDTLQHIFEPFFTTKGPGKGTGLGLAMVYGIVKQHGGHITCYSEPTQGTTFKMFFPALEVDDDTMKHEVKSTPKGGSETVLLVDDEEMIRDIGFKILTRAGYKVLVAADGKKALEVYRRRGNEISLIVLDLIMPEMGGRQCLESILKISPSAKIVIASGHVPDDTTGEVVDSKSRGFISKPFDPNQLLEIIRKVLDEA